MTDLEITKLCAEAMGYTANIGVEVFYDPLHNDAQAMALVKHSKLHIFPPASGRTNWVVRREDQHQNTLANAYNDDLNRAIVECVVKMQSAKQHFA